MRKTILLVALAATLATQAQIDISFGDGLNVTIGEGGSGDTNKMFMRGYGGILYGSSTSNGLASRVVFDFTPASGKLNIAGSTISIGAGFKVEKGGSVKISPEK